MLNTTTRSPSLRELSSLQRLALAKTLDEEICDFHRRRNKDQAQMVDRLAIQSLPEFAERDAVGAVLSMVEAEPIKESFVIEVSMISSDPERASEWLNLYIKEFMASNIEASLDRSKQVYEVIQERMAPLQEQVVAAAAALMN